MSNGSTPVETLPVVVVENGPMPLALVGERVEYIDNMKREIMKEGRDFDTIPGTHKPTLLKPGAEKLAAAFMLAPSYATTSKTEDFHLEWQYVDKKGGHTATGFYAYCVSCTLRHRETGQVWASAEGECNSRERGRETVPANTILKMAQKRAFVAAVLNSTFSSELFTQDVEDFPQSDHGTAQPVRKAPKPEPQRASTQAAPGGDDVWNVGKHKGTPMSDLDADYLLWVVDNMDKDELREKAQTEIDRRNGVEVDPTACDVPDDEVYDHDEKVIAAIESAEDLVFGSGKGSKEKILAFRIDQVGSAVLHQLSPAVLKVYKSALSLEIGA